MKGRIKLNRFLRELSKHTLEDAIIKVLYHLPAHIKDSVDHTAIQKVCAQAWYTVGIFPVRSQETRERRAALKVDMDLEHLLNAYFDTKPEHAPQKKKLIEKALKLEAHLKELE